MNVYIKPCLAIVCRILDRSIFIFVEIMMSATVKEKYVFLFLLVFFLTLLPGSASAWYSRTHLAIAKAASYGYWYNAAAADIAKIKAGDTEQFNHFVNNRKGFIVKPETVLRQAEKYNDPNDRDGHLYGAIVASIREYIKDKKEGRYPEDQMAYCVHYVGDLSMPLHNIAFTPYNKKFHSKSDGIIDYEILNNLDKIQIKKIKIRTEDDLINEIVRIANISAELGYRLERENRLMTKEEAYRQVGYSASLLKGILEYVDSQQ
jgi:hypothetical protein